MRPLSFSMFRREPITMSDPSPIYGERTRGVGGKTNRSSRLTYGQIEAMRNHPVIKFCLQFLKMPLARTPVNVQCDDPEMGAILNAMLEPVVNNYIRQAAQCLDYGFWPAEVRWARRPVQYEIDGQRYVRNCIALKTFKGLKQKNTTIIENDYGGFVGLEYTDGSPVTLLASEGKCLLVINRFEQGDRYGISELQAAKQAWDRQTQIENFAIRYYETKSDPIPVVRYDSVNVYRKGDSVLDAKQVAYELGLSARQGRPIALPSVSDDKGNPLWDIKYLEASDRSPLFRNAMEYHDVQLMRALLVPERSLTQSEATGSYSMAEAHGSFLIERQEEILDLLVEAINLYVLPRLIEYNFGDTPFTARLVSGGLREADKELSKQVISALMSSGSMTNEQREWVEKRTGIPMPTKEDKPAAPEMCDCDHSVTLAERKYRRQLQPWERNVKLAAIDNYTDMWLKRSTSALTDLYRRQTGSYIDALARILDGKRAVQQRLDAVRAMELQYQAEYRMTIYNALYELMDTAAVYASQEMGVSYPGLDVIAQGWARAQADNLWYGQDADIRKRANFESITGITAGLPDKTILYNVKTAFDTLIGLGTGFIFNGFLSLSSEAINRGREVIQRLYNNSKDGQADPIVAVIRSELLDGAECRYCKQILDMKIVDVDNPEYEEFFMVKPHWGCRGVNIYIKQSERAQYRNDPEYQFKRPTEAQRKNWIVGRVGE